MQFLEWDGRSYLESNDTGRPLAASALGGLLGHTRCELATLNPGLGYRPHNGDTGFIAPGSAVYAVRGYSTGFRLAVGDRNALRLYEVDSAPLARKGSDLLDIGGRVRLVRILDGVRETRTLGLIANSTVITTLVGDILRAPVRGDGTTNELPLFVRFALADGTSVTRAWFPRSGLLWRGIHLPSQATRILQDAMNG